LVNPSIGGETGDNFLPTGKGVYIARKKIKNESGWMKSVATVAWA